MIRVELDRWENEDWAVNVETREIFRIEDREIIEDVLVLYSNDSTDSSENLLTVREALAMEELIASI